MFPDYRYNAVLVRVVDGDTLKVDIDLGFYTWIRNVSVRLLGIDCPELSTDEGKAAKVYVASLLAPQQQVVIDTVKSDKYGGRWDGRVYLPNGVILNDHLVDAGYAVRTAC